MRVPPKGLFFAGLFVLAHFANPVEQTAGDDQGKQNVGHIARERNELQRPVEKIS